jgi:threonine/homoserine/homoserine lactone efflux protein
MRGFLTQISNPKVVVFFGSLFVAMLPSEVPGCEISGSAITVLVSPSTAVHTL